MHYNFSQSVLVCSDQPARHFNQPYPRLTNSPP